jgi:hypothetical protein
VDYLLRRLVRSATRRGLRGEHWAWFALAGAAYLLRRSRGRNRAVVYSRTVRTGDRLVVSLQAAGSHPAEPLPG